MAIVEEQTAQSRIIVLFKEHVLFLRNKLQTFSTPFTHFFTQSHVREQKSNFFFFNTNVLCCRFISV